MTAISYVIIGNAISVRAHLKLSNLTTEICTAQALPEGICFQMGILVNGGRYMEETRVSKLLHAPVMVANL